MYGNILLKYNATRICDILVKETFLTMFDDTYLMLILRTMKHFLKKKQWLIEFINGQ